MITFSKLKQIYDCKSLGMLLFCMNIDLEKANIGNKYEDKKEIEQEFMAISIELNIPINELIW